MAEPTRFGTTHLDFPPRPRGSPTGSEFIERMGALMGDITRLSQAQRLQRMAEIEELAFQEIRRGNVPDFMRRENWPELPTQITVGERTITARIRVCPDYLAIGSNDNYIYMPLNPRTAQRLADEFGFSLPWPIMVDRLDNEARRTGGLLRFHRAPELAEGATHPTTGRPIVEREVPGQPRQPWVESGFYEGAWSLSPQFIGEHSRLMRADRDRAVRAARDAGHAAPTIFSGTKKDVVYDFMANGQAVEGGSPVVIYHKGIQGMSNTHNWRHYDYSHGIRFLDSAVPMTITERDGTARQTSMTIAEILRHPQYCRLLNPGPMDISRMYRTETEQPRRVAQTH